jgi:hypothetical protein
VLEAEDVDGRSPGRWQSKRRKVEVEEMETLQPN